MHTKPLLALKVPTLHVWGSEFDAQNHVTMLGIVVHTGNPSARKHRRIPANSQPAKPNCWTPCKWETLVRRSMKAFLRTTPEAVFWPPPIHTSTLTPPPPHTHIYVHPADMYPAPWWPNPKAAVSSRSWWSLLPHCRRSGKKSTLCMSSLLSWGAEHRRTLSKMKWCHRVELHLGCLGVKPRECEKLLLGTGDNFFRHGNLL